MNSSAVCGQMVGRPGSWGSGAAGISLEALRPRGLSGALQNGSPSSCRLNALVSLAEPHTRCFPNRGCSLHFHYIPELPSSRVGTPPLCLSSLLAPGCREGAPTCCSPCRCPRTPRPWCRRSTSVRPTASTRSWLRPPSSCSRSSCSTTATASSRSPSRTWATPCCPWTATLTWALR